MSSLSSQQVVSKSIQQIMCHGQKMGWMGNGSSIPSKSKHHGYYEIYWFFPSPNVDLQSNWLDHGTYDIYNGLTKTEKAAENCWSWGKSHPRLMFKPHPDPLRRMTGTSPSYLSLLKIKICFCWCHGLWILWIPCSKWSTLRRGCDPSNRPWKSIDDQIWDQYLWIKGFLDAFFVGTL